MMDGIRWEHCKQWDIKEVKMISTVLFEKKNEMLDKQSNSPFEIHPGELVTRNTSLVNDVGPVYIDATNKIILIAVFRLHVCTMSQLWEYMKIFGWTGENEVLVERVSKLLECEFLDEYEYNDSNHLSFLVLGFRGRGFMRQKKNETETYYNIKILRLNLERSDDRIKKLLAANQTALEIIRKNRECKYYVWKRYTVAEKVDEGGIFRTSSMIQYANEEYLIQTVRSSDDEKEIIDKVKRINFCFSHTDELRFHFNDPKLVLVCENYAHMVAIIDSFSRHYMNFQIPVLFTTDDEAIKNGTRQLFYKANEDFNISDCMGRKRMKSNLFRKIASLVVAAY